MEAMFTKMFEYIGLHFSEVELQSFVENVIEPHSNVFATAEKTDSDGCNQRLRTCYNTHVRPKCPSVTKHPFPGPSIEERLAYLEQEHHNTRVIQASFVDLLREHRESFDAQLARSVKLI